MNRFMKTHCQEFEPEVAEWACVEVEGMFSFLGLITLAKGLPFRPQRLTRTG